MTVRAASDANVNAGTWEPAASVVMEKLSGVRKERNECGVALEHVIDAPSSGPIALVDPMAGLCDHRRITELP